MAEKLTKENSDVLGHDVVYPVSARASLIARHNIPPGSAHSLLSSSRCTSACPVSSARLQSAIAYLEGSLLFCVHFAVCRAIFVEVSSCAIDPSELCSCLYLPCSITSFGEMKVLWTTEGWLLTLTEVT